MWLVSQRRRLQRIVRLYHFRNPAELKQIKAQPSARDPRPNIKNFNAVIDADGMFYIYQKIPTLRL